MIVSGAAPPMVDALRRVRRCMSRRVFCRFCHARSRAPIVFSPFHCCAFCERATPDAPETIDDQRRCTGCRYRTIYGGSRGSASRSASLPPAIADHVCYRVRAPDALERIPTAAAVPPADLWSAGRPVPLLSSRSEMELLPDSQNPGVC
jgi:hypothetical protein